VIPNRQGQGDARWTFWLPLVKEALRSTVTPFYLFSSEPIREALAQLQGVGRGIAVPIRHWLSFKTQPLRPLVRWWRNQGHSIEVVSEFEFLAALREGFTPDQILVNGPAKQRWLTRHPVEGLRVNFDSNNEARDLASLARRLNWSVGVRCRTAEEHDSEEPHYPTQFGMAGEQAFGVLKRLARARLRLETIHFHLRTHVPSVVFYRRALEEIVGVCQAAGFAPKYLDCGGGYPAPDVRTLQGRRYDRRFRFGELGNVYARALKQLPSVRELWLENGRFASARSGVLVVRVLETKDSGRVRHVICDGGRTQHALISTWESHGLFSVPQREGRLRHTVVCGPTCMAFDQLTRCPLPETLRPGDCLIWLDAGAYHLPWETRFSHGYAAVLWHEDGRLSPARRAESFDAWWGQWED
jgi:diaminopimelate decarboxylase